jgi:hypothetical protein
MTLLELDSKKRMSLLEFAGDSPTTCELIGAAKSGLSGGFEAVAGAFGVVGTGTIASNTDGREDLLEFSSSSSA